MAIAFKLEVRGRDCQVHANKQDCEGPIQAAHLIPKQSLRRRRLPENIVWDPRNGLAACYGAHRRSDSGLARFPVDIIPDKAWEFADELGLGWMLEKLYGQRRAA